MGIHKKNTNKLKVLILKLKKKNEKK